MLETSFMMILLIQGRQSIGKDKDVYLRPFIDELKQLSEEGFDTYNFVR